MTNEIDITNNRYGRLVAIKKEKSINGQNMWLFQCDCGKQKIINKYSVIRGFTNSFGCYHKEQDVLKHTTHNMSKTRLYRCWQDMKNRCYNPSRKKYKIYGGRGIIVCSEWKNSFENFSDWSLRNSYKEGLSLDRIDVNGNYCPENCRWTTMKEQNNNRRNNHKITINNETKNLCEWLEIFKMDSGSFYYKLKKGYKPEEIFKV